MKSICTQIAFFALLLIANTSFAQTCSVSSSNSGPSLGFPTTVSSTNGFTSTNGTVGAFPKMQTTTLTSPAYHYTTNQTTVYFAYTFTKAQAGSTMDAPVVSLLYGTNFAQTVSATSSTIYNFADGTSTVYFSITPGFTINANADFKIQLSLTLTGSDKAITATTLYTNAIPTTANAPLPVKFIGFSAKKSGSAVVLTWTVGTEESLSGYQVEKSTDGISFSKIAFVNATAQTSYTFTDSKPATIAYYRIKSIDISETYAYSTVVTIKGDASSVVFKAFPTPVQSSLTVQYSAVTNGKIEIASADGRILKSLSLASGEQQTSIDLSAANAGVYFVRLVTNNSVETLKIIKQ